MILDQLTASGKIAIEVGEYGVCARRIAEPGVV